LKKCQSCGQDIGWLDHYGPGGTLCKKCNVAYIRGPDHPEVKAVNKRVKAANEKHAAIAAVMLTTETYPQGLNITERIEAVTAECAFGMNIFKDLFSGIRDIVGGRSEAVQKTLRDSRRTALFELKKEAYEVGANAVVGVDLDYVELSASGKMVLLVASGTEVKIEI